MRLEQGSKAKGSGSGEHWGSVRVKSQGEAWDRSNIKVSQVRGEGSKVKMRLSSESGA